MARIASLAVAASSTDGALVTARAGQKVRVTGGLIAPGASTTVTLNSKSGGAGTAITPPFATAIALPDSSDGWFDSNVGEGLTVTTSAGATSGVVIDYVWVTP